jgi:hypothetical protein
MVTPHGPERILATRVLPALLEPSKRAIVVGFTGQLPESQTAVTGKMSDIRAPLDGLFPPSPTNACAGLQPNSAKIKSASSKRVIDE